MPSDANAILRSGASYAELERLSALETLKALKTPSEVRLTELVDHLRERGLWEQFAKITLGDLRRAYQPEPEPTEAKGRKRKKRILEDELGDAPVKKAKPTEPEDGGIETDEVARQVLPFVEGNGDVSFEDLADYTRLDRKVLRFHLNALVKDEKLERLGTGKNAVYSTLG